METQRPDEQEPQESGREMVQRVLGETLHQLEFVETDLMRELRGIVREAMANDEPAVALTAYARYQEVGQEHILATTPNDARAKLALNIACAQLLAVRGEQDRCINAIEDCITQAKSEGYGDIADELGYFLT